MLATEPHLSPETKLRIIVQLTTASERFCRELYNSVRTVYNEGHGHNLVPLIYFHHQVNTNIRDKRDVAIYRSHNADPSQNHVHLCGRPTQFVTEDSFTAILVTFKHNKKHDRVVSIQSCLSKDLTIIIYLIMTIDDPYTYLNNTFFYKIYLFSC